MVYSVLIQFGICPLVRACLCWVLELQSYLDVPSPLLDADALPTVSTTPSAVEPAAKAVSSISCEAASGTTFCFCELPCVNISAICCGVLNGSGGGDGCALDRTLDVAGFAGSRVWGWFALASTVVAAADVLMLWRTNNHGTQVCAASFI